MKEYIPGQRWMSETEPELGLGMVIAYANKRVQLVFPAADTERVYGTQNAPLKRVIFHSGDILTTIEGWEFEVTESKEEAGVIYYQLEEQWIPEAAIASTMSFNKPEERLLAGQIDSLDHYDLRYLTLKYQKQLLSHPMRGFFGPRMSLLPHQLYVAHETVNRPLPRVLLADEVGLGKTIEAGIILHQLITSGRAERVLIITPRTLIHQWFVEMLRRFNLAFSVMDSDDHFDPGENPFDTRSLMISSIQLLKGSPLASEMVFQANYDVIVVDEAHLLQWSEQEVSQDYQIVERLAASTPGLLLLTATPEQLGQEGHFARLRLLDPHRFKNLENFLAEQQQYTQIAEMANKLFTGEPLNPQEQQFLEQLTAREGQAAWMSQLKDPQVRHQLLSLLVDTHGTGRIYYRNTRSQMAKEYDFFTNRKYIAQPLGQAVDPKDKDFKKISFLLHKEWLLSFLAQHADEKSLLICRSKEKVLALEESIRNESSFKTAIFHSGLNLMNRDRQAVYFTDPKGAQILLCTEMGSEGRNFQFAKNLILFDLPTDPNLLEQRIGRLDRIGQKNDVHIYVPFVSGSSEEVLARWYHEGLNAFEKTALGADRIQEEVQEEMHHCLMNPQDVFSGKLDRLVKRTKEHYNAIVAELESGRDRLVELHSFNKERANTLVKNIRQEENKPDLKHYMQLVFHNMGVDSEDLDALSEYIRPSDNMYVPHFPELPAEGFSATFDRSKAQEREDLRFLSWDHPMVIGAMDLILSSEIGNATAACWIDEASISPLLLELLYVFETAAPKKLNLGRYAPPTGIRLLLDPQNKNHSQILSKPALDEKVQKPTPQQIEGLASLPKEKLLDWISQAKRQATERGEQLKQKYRLAASERFDNELQRLTSLRQKNQSVSELEISALQQERDLVLACIQDAGVRLDSLRIIF